jgi:benzodiazapine receptor
MLTMDMGKYSISPPGYKWFGLLLLLVITAFAAAIGTIASVNAPDFYTMLAKPAWAPSPRVFGPIWTVLYLLMAVAAWLVWLRGGLGVAKVPLMLYLAQLALNALWTWLFFRWRLGGWAFIEIIVLWFILILMLVSFWRVRAMAGILLLPYLLWVTFAAVLMAKIWRLNQGIL